MRRSTKMISQGTISVLVGCHSPIHSILVLMAWIKLYKKWPKFWQIVCIFLHDIGHFGLNYLSDYEQKKMHWRRGATIACKLFGSKGFLFVAAHDINTIHQYNEHPLYRSDRYSWSIAPYCWLYSNCIFEPKLRMGYTINKAVKIFRDMVRESINTGKFHETHSFFLKRSVK